jgi:hypothetical protein
MGIQNTGASTGGVIIRRFIALVVVFLTFWLVWLWLISPPSLLPARYAAADCWKAIVLDPEGAPVEGAEDILLVPNGGQLIISSHDRLSQDLNGGLYAVSPFDVSRRGAVVAKRLSPSVADGRTFRPHGIAVSDTGNTLAVINRVAPGTAQIEIGPLTRDSWTPETTIKGQDVCRANNLVFPRENEDAVYVSIDRQDCFASLGDLMPGASTGRVQFFAGGTKRTTLSDLKFPNGLLIDQNTSLPLVAETRGARIHRPAGSPLSVPGGPDNLSIDEDGNVVAALHPSLVQLWFYLNDWRDHAPSRIVRVDIDRGAIEVLFDDPKGEVFAGATSALMIRDMLIAGSVRDQGLLVCRKGEM